MPDAVMPPTEWKTELAPGTPTAAAKDNGCKTRDLLMVPIGNIKTLSGFNVRIPDATYETKIEELKQSILTNGFHQHKPLTGYAAKEGDNTFIFVTDGYTRFEAAKRAAAEGAPIEVLPVVLRANGTSMADLTVGLVMDNSGNPLRPQEKAIVVKRLTSFGWEEAQIAEKLVMSPQYVKDLLYFMALPNALRQVVIGERASLGSVVQLARKVGATEALKAYESQPQPPAQADNTATGAARVSPRAAAAASGGKSPAIAKKTLFTAIDYAIALDAEGITWLGRWRKGEHDAVKELESYKPPRKKRSDAKPKAEKSDKPKGKPGRKPKKTATPPAEGDDAPL